MRKEKLKKNSIQMVRDFVEQHSNSHEKELPPPFARVSFNLQLPFSYQDQQTTVQIECTLPLLYPNLLPSLQLNSDFFTRETHKNLTDDLTKHWDELEDQHFLLEGIIWLHEKAPAYFSPMTPLPSPKEPEAIRQIFRREWYWSHHIYSKTKRQNLIDWAKSLDLSGFSMIGKPGVICVEGDIASVEDFSSRLRRLTWKKLSTRLTKDFDYDPSQVSDQKRFDNFEELQVAMHGKGNHSDIGQVKRILEEKGLSDEFKQVLPLV